MSNHNVGILLIAYQHFVATAEDIVVVWGYRDSQHQEPGDGVVWIEQAVHYTERVDGSKN